MFFFGVSYFEKWLKTTVPSSALRSSVSAKSTTPLPLETGLSRAGVKGGRVEVKKVGPIQ